MPYRIICNRIAKHIIMARPANAAANAGDPWMLICGEAAEWNPGWQMAAVNSENKN